MHAIFSRFIDISLTANDAELCVRWLEPMSHEPRLLAAEADGAGLRQTSAVLILALDLIFAAAPAQIF